MTARTWRRDIGDAVYTLFGVLVFPALGAVLAMRHANDGSHRYFVITFGVLPALATMFLGWITRRSGRLAAVMTATSAVMGGVIWVALIFIAGTSGALD